MGDNVAHIHKDLVERCKGGDTKAQFELYRLYSTAMFNICTRMMNTTSDAEDVLQESFISAFRNLHKYEEKSSFGAWLKRIVVNKCITLLNKQKQLDFVALNGIPSEAEEEPEEGSISPEMVHHAIKALPTGCRTIFTLYSLEGYSHQEIASILNVSVSTSKSQHNRAKKLLRVSLLKKKHHEIRS